MRALFTCTGVTVSGKTRHILTAEKAFEQTAVCAGESEGLHIYANRDDMMKLALLFLAASREKQGIFYLPLRGHGLPEDLQTLYEPQETRDLVVMSHTEQFPVKDWKTVRARLQTGAREEERTYCLDPESEPKRIDKSFWYRENKDFLKIHDAAGTIFFTGSEKVYRALARECLFLYWEKLDPEYEFPLGYYHEHFDRYMREADNTDCCLVLIEE